jgi:hypothetical protein
MTEQECGELMITLLLYEVWAGLLIALVWAVFILFRGR